jgi:hypothetical protein
VRKILSSCVSEHFFRSFLDDNQLDFIDVFHRHKRANSSKLLNQIYRETHHFLLASLFHTVFAVCFHGNDNCSSIQYPHQKHDNDDTPDVNISNSCRCFIDTVHPVHRCVSFCCTCRKTVLYNNSAMAKQNGNSPIINNIINTENAIFFKMVEILMILPGDETRLVPISGTF